MATTNTDLEEAGEILFRDGMEILEKLGGQSDWKLMKVQRATTCMGLGDARDSYASNELSFHGASTIIVNFVANDSGHKVVLGPHCGA